MLREGSDAHISLRVTAFSEHTNTGDDDRSEHHERAAAENGIRKGRQNDAEAGDDASQNHKCRAAADSLTVYDLGHSDKTDILAEGCDRHAAEKGRQRAHEAIDGDGAGDFTARRLTAVSLHGKSTGIP